MALSLKRKLGLLALAVLGAAALVYVTSGLIVDTVLDERVKPVRARVEADWRAQRATLEADLASTAKWSAVEGESPAGLGCRLKWSPRDRPSVKQHEARCGDEAIALPAAALDQLRALGPDVLKREAEAPVVEVPFAWMADLKGAGRWRFETGTPWEFEPPNPYENSILNWPLLDIPHARALTTLRLLHGLRTGTLEDAVADTEALARALLSSPALIPQLTGVAVLRITREELDALGQRDLGPSAEEIAALKRSRYAVGFLWGPWVPKDVRDALDARAPMESHCAAAWEGSLYALELGVLLREPYAAHFAELDARRKTPGWCDSPLLDAMYGAPPPPADDQWRKITSPDTLGGDEAGGTGLLVTLAKVSPTARRAFADVLLAIATPQPVSASSASPDAGVAP